MLIHKRVFTQFIHIAAFLGVFYCAQGVAWSQESIETRVKDISDYMRLRSNVEAQLSTTPDFFDASEFKQKSQEANLAALLKRTGVVLALQNVYQKVPEQKLEDTFQLYESLRQEKSNDASWNHSLKELDLAVLEMRENGAWGGGNSFYASEKQKPILLDFATAKSQFNDEYGESDQIKKSEPNSVKGFPEKTNERYFSLGLTTVELNKLKSYSIAVASLEKIEAALLLSVKTHSDNLKKELEQVQESAGSNSTKQNLQKLKDISLRNEKFQSSVFPMIALFRLLELSLADLIIFYSDWEFGLNPQSVYIPKFLMKTGAYYSPVASYMSVVQNLDGKNIIDVNSSSLILSLSEWNKLGLYSQAGLLVHESIRRLHVGHRINISPADIQALTAEIIFIYLEAKNSNQELSINRVLQLKKFINGELRQLAKKLSATPSSEAWRQVFNRELQLIANDENIKSMHDLMPNLVELVMIEDPSKKRTDTIFKIEHMLSKRGMGQRRYYLTSP